METAAVTDEYEEEGDAFPTLTPNRQHSAALGKLFAQQGANVPSSDMAEKTHGRHAGKPASLVELRTALAAKASMTAKQIIADDAHKSDETIGAVDELHGFDVAETVSLEDSLVGLSVAQADVAPPSICLPCRGPWLQPIRSCERMPSGF